MRLLAAFVALQSNCIEADANIVADRIWFIENKSIEFQPAF